MEILLLNTVSVIPYSIIKIKGLRGENWILVMVKPLINSVACHFKFFGSQFSYPWNDATGNTKTKSMIWLYSSVYLFSKRRPIIFFENEKNYMFSRSYFLIIKIKLIFCAVKMQSITKWFSRKSYFQSTSVFLNI